MQKEILLLSYIQHLALFYCTILLIQCKFLLFEQHRKELSRFDKKTLRPKLTQAEGFILGVGAKMFTIAGPVLVYGISASVVYGLIYWITTRF